MNEMQALAELGTRLDPPSAHPPAELRRRVMTATTRRRRFGMPRLGVRLAAAGALAAVATGAILIGQVVQIGDRPPASTAEATEILRGAAAQAQRRPSVPVRADQFVFVESIATSASIAESGGGAATVESRERRIWLSVDGTNDGMTGTRPKGGSEAWKERPINGCRDGMMAVRKGDFVGQTACEPEPGYQRDLPTDPDAMLTYLRGRGDSKNGPDQDAFTAAGDLIREAYLAPAVLAAVFEAVGRIPGVTVAGDVTDEAGRAGVAVTRDEVQGLRAELIFDPRTFEYLGERVVVLRDQDGLRAGQILNSTAVLRVAVVSAAGRLP